MVTRARFAGQLRCLALAKLRFAANARPLASEIYARNPGFTNNFTRLRDFSGLDGAG
jgi:hypothetical protein